MKIMPRTQFGNPILRTAARKVPPVFVRTAEFRSLVRQMFVTMHAARGVGLAAPQVGHAIRLAIIGISGKTHFRRVLINPRIIWHSKKKDLDWEGCLSFVGVRGRVPRWNAVQVEYLDEKGEKVTETHRGYAARVFQHEIDHLNGVVYIDRMTDMKTLMTQKEFLTRIAR